MEIDQLRYLVTIANVHSIGIAAEQLHVSRQSISKSIKNLEDELATQIFLRSNQGVALTAAGQELYEKALEIIQRLDEMQSYHSSAQKKDHTLRGHFSIAFTSVFSELLYESLDNLIDDYPNLKVHSYSVNSTPNIEEIATKKDTVFCLAMLKDEMDKFQKIINKNFYCYSVREENMKVLMSSRHVLANQKTVSLKQLAQYPAIFFSNQSMDENAGKNLFKQKGYKPNIYLTTNNCELALYHVKNNKAFVFGGNFLSYDVLGYTDNMVRVIPLSEAIKIMYVFLFPRYEMERTERNSSKIFYEIISANFKLNPIMYNK